MSLRVQQIFVIFLTFYPRIEFQFGLLEYWVPYRASGQPKTWNRDEFNLLGTLLTKTKTSSPIYKKLSNFCNIYSIISSAYYTFYLPYPYSPCIPKPISISSSFRWKLGENPGIEQELIDTPSVKVFYKTFWPRSWRAWAIRLATGLKKIHFSTS